MKPEQVRRRILEAGIHEFATRGFDVARIEDIAARAGVGKGSVYLHYRNKKALFLECLNETERVYGESLLGLDVHGCDAGEALRRLFSFTFEFFMGHEEYRRLWLDVYRLSPDDPDLKSYLDSSLDVTIAMISELLQRGIHDGVFRPLDPNALREVSLTLMAWFEGLSLYWVYVPGFFDANRQVEQMLGMFLPYLNPASADSGAGD